jgi:hypothetical protein
VFVLALVLLVAFNAIERAHPRTAPLTGRMVIASATLMTSVAGYVDVFLCLRHHTFCFARAATSSSWRSR